MDLRRLPRSAAYIGINRYFITVNVRERQRLFTNGQLVATCRGQIQSVCKANAFQILADCYMPDHLHLLLEGLTGDADLRQCVKDAKQRTSYQAVRSGVGRLWQAGYHDRIVRQDEDITSYADYIVQNPVRAGLVARASDYPYASTVLPVAPDLQVGRSGFPIRDRQHRRDKEAALPGEQSERKSQVLQHRASNRSDGPGT